MRKLLVAGVDEVGRGPLAGPVVAAAVILNHDYAIQGLDDSKRLSASRRQQLDTEIRNHALCFSIGQAAVREIDELNILQATFLAMQRAVAGLKRKPDKALVDGNRLPSFACHAEAVVGGDGSVAEISAASIIAKVFRDRLMAELHQQYPSYGFIKNQGYPTQMHREALKKYGPAPCHRRSFAPVREAMRLHGL